MTHGIEVNNSARRRIVGMLIKLQTNSRCVTAEQNKINPISLLVGASNRQRVPRLNLADLRRCSEITRQILFRRWFRQ